MADNFDAVDIAYDLVKDILTDVFKDKSPENQSGEHIVINAPSATPSGNFVSDVPVNINIFVPVTANKMINRTRIKTLRDSIYTEIDGSEDPEGFYCIKERAFSGPIEGAKEGFDCFSIRYFLTLNTY